MSKRFILSGGGTGGHIFPALAIGEEILRREPDARLLYVGAIGGMEMDVIPRHGHEIKGVWISGIHRQLTVKNLLRNLSFPLKLVVSMVQAGRLVNEFKPDAVIGVGGFASAPVGRVASRRDIPLFLCEQNAFPGLVNRWLTPMAKLILLGNEDAGKYFPKEKSLVTGNPIRNFTLPDRDSAIKALGLDPARPVVLSLGGSLGAQRLNTAWKAGFQQMADSGVQLLWQAGKRYYETLRAELPEHASIRLMPFIEDMAIAYAAADLVVSRAGGSTISELIALSKPAILVPSPNVAEDHQTKNAHSLVDRGAALLVKDAEAAEQLVSATLTLVQNPEKLQALKQAALSIEKHNAAQEIVDAIFASN